MRLGSPLWRFGAHWTRESSLTALALAEACGGSLQVMALFRPLGGAVLIYRCPEIHRLNLSSWAGAGLNLIPQMSFWPRVVMADRAYGNFRVLRLRRPCR